MFKFSRNRIQKISGNCGLLVLRLSFLLTFGLWFWAIYDKGDGFFDILMGIIVALIAALITFEWVTLGLCILLIPVVILGRTIAQAFRDSDG